MASAESTHDIHPAARGIATILAVCGTLLADRVPLLMAAYLCVLVPIILYAGLSRTHGYFFLTVIAPIGVALIFVWGFLVAAPPGAASGSNPQAGLAFAATTTLRLVLLGGIVQLSFLTIPADRLAATFSRWGIKGDSLIALVGSVALLAELRTRVGQVVTARYARGLRHRNLLSGLWALPSMLRPLVAWVLRSAIQRAEVWNQRNLLARFVAQLDRKYPTRWSPNSLYMGLACVWFLTALGFRLSALATTTTAFALSSIACALTVLCMLAYYRRHSAADAAAASASTSMAVSLGAPGRISDSFADLAGPGQVMALAGPNFSGRTDLLRQWTGLDHQGAVSLPNESTRPRIYIGPEIYNALSGLAGSVDEELRLHGCFLRGRESVMTLVEEAGLMLLRDRSPFKLSGGEQAKLAITSALALNPAALAIDCALEQLDAAAKGVFVKHFSSTYDTCVVMADNRLSDTSDIATVLSMDETLRQRIASAHALSLQGMSPTIALPSPAVPSCHLGLEDVTFAYPGAPLVLRGLSLQLDPGHVYVLHGANGAGKSTLAKLLSGVRLRPRSGRILCNGVGVQPWTKPGHLVAYHFQNPDLQLLGSGNPPSVENEIMEGPIALHLPRDDRIQRTEAVIAAFGLGGIRHHNPLDLPFVLRKRVAMAATLAMGRPWVILDEPTLGQDDSFTRDFAALLSHLIKVGTGIIIITHSVGFRNIVAHEQLELANGVIVSQRTEK